MLAAAYPAGTGTAPDATALAVLEETAEYLGAGFADLINLFQPEREAEPTPPSPAWQTALRDRVSP